MRYSDSYVATIDPMSAADMEKLQAIRATVKATNKNSDVKRYVKLHGRGSRIEATWQSGNPSNYVAFCRELPLRFAERMDVYIYRR